MAKVIEPETMFADLEKAYVGCECEVALSSHAPLYWFLRYVFGLEDVDAQDAICDGGNDKGIDAIHVDADQQVIYVLQSKRKEKLGSDLGDADLRHLVGTLQQLSTSIGAETLAATANAALSGLIARHDIVHRIAEGYTVKGVFLTNIPADTAARDYLAMIQGNPELDLWDLARLFKVLCHIRGPEYVSGPAVLHTTKNGSIEYELSPGVSIIVGLFPGADIANLPGIDDDTLFAHNVRGPLGNTRINRDIQHTIQEQAEHELFPAYHNGMTVICKSLERKKGRLELSELSVVNGCQSAKTIANNRKHISKDLRVLVKIVHADPESSPLAYDLTDKITQRSNNQNAISMRDLRSTDKKQRALVSEFEALFGAQVAYDIKRGARPEATRVISNDLAAQQLVSLYCREPWRAHLKTSLFDAMYDKVFSDGIHAEQVYLADMIYNSAIDNRNLIEDTSVKTYKLTAFVLSYLVGTILDKEGEGRSLLADPKPEITDPVRRAALTSAINGLVKTLIVDLNYFISEQRAKDEYFDYKRAFKQQAAINSLAVEAGRQYDRDKMRDPADAFRLS